MKLRAFKLTITQSLIHHVHSQVVHALHAVRAAGALSPSVPPLPSHLRSALLQPEGNGGISAVEGEICVCVHVYVRELASSSWQ